MFAYVGGIYFFLSHIINFAARSINFLTVKFLKYMRHKTRPHIQRIRSYSVNIRTGRRQGTREKTIGVEEGSDNDDNIDGDNDDDNDDEIEVFETDELLNAQDND